VNLKAARRAYAEELRVVGHVADDRVIEAFATVPRELFVGAGPWRVLNLYETAYWTTADSDPRALYHNVLIALDESRRLNTGEPSFWAHHFDRVGVRRGDRVLQIGTGSGYFTALLAQLVGPSGQVVGYEVDGALAAAAADNLEPWPQASVRKSDGVPEIEGHYDVIVAFCGLTRPPASWLDALAPGGRALIPLTTEQGWGFVLRLDRAQGIAARVAGHIAIYPAQGLRDPAEAAALGQVVNDGAGRAALRSLRREPHGKEDTCWLHGNGWCLSRRGLA
jgi:protein-L-isoaspartate(D-aspartate) O-methyltransferase